MDEQINENISSQADIQNKVPEKELINPEKYKMMAVNDVKTIQNLMRLGVMPQKQGQDLMEYVAQMAFEKYMGSLYPEQQPEKSWPDSTPDFFNRSGRLEVYDYLKNSGTDFDGDEISKISGFIEKIEDSAVQRYLEKQEHEKALNNENEAAKQRLRANAQNNMSDGLKNLVFTREQIGKMSGAEFAKHERAIMDQLKKGLIK